MGERTLCVLPPDPSRAAEGLRDTGYLFNTALADILDNSLDAGASVIRINIEMDIAGEVSVRVADNGCGMHGEELQNALKYGSKSRIEENPRRLGRFGLGLKTAATAFCRKLVVISRGSGESEIHKAFWDLDHIRDVNEWELRTDEISEEEEAALEEVAAGGSGTLVKWDKVDRLLKDYAQPGGGRARTALRRIIDGFKFHVAMVFQRFLDPQDPRAFNIELFINGEAIQAWDPFCTQEKETQLVAQKVPMKAKMPDDSEIDFEVRAYVIPRREQFSTPEAAKMARLNNDMQGFYIYRENRLIHYGDYLGIYRNEPHYSLLRIDFTFDHLLDERFNMDIKKSRIMLDSEIHYWLSTSFLTAPRHAAEQCYRMSTRTLTHKLAKDAHDASNINIQTKEKDLLMSEIVVTDKETGQVEVINRQGKVIIKLPIIDPSKEGELVVQPVDGIVDGLLWEPILIEGHHAVRINTGHPFYYKVYTPNLVFGVTVQGIDSLLWALCEAELGTMNQATKQYFSELRFEVSRLLRRLVEDLPDPEPVEQLV